jgi:hypothetical protein
VPVYRGVYAIGGAVLGERGWGFAALLAAGDGAVLSHRWAASLWGVLPRPARVEVSLPHRKLRSRAGLTIHVVTPFAHGDIQHRDGLPLTAPVRTLLDLAATVERNELEAALREARVLGLLGDAELKRALDGHRGRAGAARLREALEGSGSAPTRSRLERTMLRLIAAAGLPRPLVSHRIGRFTVDFVWPEQRVVVETDGWHAHGHRAAFEDDRARDAELAGLGYVVLRFTWRQIADEPLRVAARLGEVLAARRGGVPG